MICDFAQFMNNIKLTGISLTLAVNSAIKFTLLADRVAPLYLYARHFITRKKKMLCKLLHIPIEMQIVPIYITVDVFHFTRKFAIKFELFYMRIIAIICKCRLHITLSR